MFIWVLLLTAAAKPQWLGEPVTIPQEGRELMLAVDLSGSMQYEDMMIGPSKSEPVRYVETRAQ